MCVLGSTSPSKKKHLSLARKVHTYSEGKVPSKSSDMVRCSGSNRQEMSSPPSPLDLYENKLSKWVDKTYQKLSQEWFRSKCTSGTFHHQCPEPLNSNILALIINYFLHNVITLPIFRRRQIHSCWDSVWLSRTGHRKQISWRTAEATVCRGVSSWTSRRISRIMSR